MPVVPNKIGQVLSCRASFILDGPIQTKRTSLRRLIWRTILELFIYIVSSSTSHTLDAVVMAKHPVCYTAGYKSITSTNQYFPCGAASGSSKAQSCCASGDYCMEDGICHYKHGGVVNGTGFYMAGCTDSTWEDPACPKQCVSQYGADIIYDRANREWKCCESTEDTLNCQQPTDLVVEAAGPGDLSTVVHITSPAPSKVVTTKLGSIPSHNTRPAITPTSAETSLASSSSVPIPNQGIPEQLSPGAKAGINVAVVLLLIIAFGGGYFYRKRIRAREITKKPPEYDDDPEAYGSRSPSVQHYAGNALSNNMHAHKQYVDSNKAEPSRSPRLGIPSNLPERDPRKAGEKNNSFDEAYAGAVAIHDGAYEMQIRQIRKNSGQGARIRSIPKQRQQRPSELEGDLVKVAELDAVSRPVSAYSRERSDSRPLSRQCLIEGISSGDTSPMPK